MTNSKEYLIKQLAYYADKANKYGDTWSDPQWEAHNFEVSQLEEWLSNLG